MSEKIENSRAIITGGAQGIGFQISRHLLMNEAKTIAILDINESAGVESMKKLNDEFGEGRSLFFVTDVSNADQFKENFHKAVEELGGLEIVINNAGILDYKRWESMLDINIKGVINGTMLGFDHMGKHKGGKGGTIINMGSIAPIMKDSFSPIYSASKAAIMTYSRIMGTFYDKSGVAIKVMCPGRTESNLITFCPDQFLDYLVKPDDAAEIIKSLPALKPEDVALEVMALIKDPSTSTTWVKIAEVPTSRLYFLDFPDNLIPHESQDD
ncbi:15-hydroxyprostaglandin dehydrogenase [NAD(+)]-like [Chelonus insularis]|uniref:15-hydroxyprostaglandin dehydrogenase [NAD(+)]-like n=1 Tax=Chelonus insularis TaxID=460826 RepID=UPI00158D5706|nr:15-hydroxyprostaglandin dehydrogenase [NAD(+)]-like [Chelonus insularis]